MYQNMQLKLDFEGWNPGSVT